MFSRVGSMIAPFIATQLAVKAHWLPPVVFGVFPIIGAFLVFFLPGEVLQAFSIEIRIIKYFLQKLEDNRCPRQSKTVKISERNSTKSMTRN